MTCDSSRDSYPDRISAEISIIRSALDRLETELEAFRTAPGITPGQRRQMNEGRRRKSQNGGYSYGSPPYGWDAANGELIPNMAEQGIRLRMLKMRYQDGCSYRRIARELNADGIPAKRGGEWSSVTVRRVILQDRPGWDGDAVFAARPGKIPPR